MKLPKVESIPEHTVIRAMLVALRKGMEQNSFELRNVEAMIVEAKSVGNIDKMQMSMNGAALMAKTTRDSVNAGLMLIDKLEAGLDENEKQRDRIVALEAEIGQLKEKREEISIGCLN